MTYQRAFQALGDRTRRSIFERLRGGPLPVGEIARGFAVSRPAVSQHLRVLKEARLVQEQRAGNRRLYSISPDGLLELQRYLETFWGEVLDAFKLEVHGQSRKENDMPEKEMVVRKSVTVQCPVEEAFRFFTNGLSTWWPLDSFAAGEKPVSCAIEGRVGGRLYEVDAEGHESLWGTVTLWEPPRKVAFTWHPGHDESTAQQVLVVFEPATDGTTLRLEHRGWEVLGDRAQERAASYDSGWDLVLGHYVSVASRAVTR